MRPPDFSPPRAASHLLVFAAYLMLSASWSWPLARFDPSVLVTRHFDLYPTAWLVQAAPGTFPGLHHPASAWPTGESLARVDSYLLYVLGLLAGRSVSPSLLVQLLAWVGPAVSALVAERCAADGFGVRRPWSLLAGALYGFAGIAAVAVLEGHVHHLLNPWLPGLWWAWARGGRARHGLVVGLAFALALFTSAYAGVNALLLLAALASGDPRRALRLAPGVAAVALPAGLYYARLFAAGGRFGDGEAPLVEQVGRMGTVSLAGLAGVPVTVDLHAHSLAAPLGFVGIFLAALAPAVLRGERGWRAPAVLAVLAVLVALGRDVRLDEGALVWAWPADALAELPGATFFRFPARLLWLWALVTGVVGARVLGALADRAPRGPGVLVLGIGLAEATWAPLLPARLDRVPAAAPSAYAAAPLDRPLLDLYGRPVDRSGGELEMWARNLGCYYQARHRRPILEVCIGTAVQSPREHVQRYLLRRLGDPAAVQTLTALGLGAVAVHADTFRPGDLDWLASALAARLGEPAESADGGERLLLWVVPATSGADSPAAWEIVVAGGR